MKPMQTDDDDDPKNPNGLLSIWIRVYYIYYYLQHL